MAPIVATVVQVLAVLTVVGQVAVLALLVLWGVSRLRRLAIVDVLATNALIPAFVISLIATSGSLFFSEVAGFFPCTLCWYQRILMYPQVVLLGIALWRADPGIAVYSGALSLLGAGTAAYHYLLQIGVVEISACSTGAFAVSCSQRYLNELGYITIPMMALTAFLLVACLLALQARSPSMGRLTKS